MRTVFKKSQDHARFKGVKMCKRDEKIQKIVGSCCKIVGMSKMFLVKRTRLKMLLFYQPRVRLGDFVDFTSTD